jgi:hypothetical protein
MPENARGFKAKQKKYAHWKANPYRNETLGQFAEKIKVNEKTLWRWNKLPGFKEYVDNLTDEYVGHEEADVWRALLESAKDKEEGSADRKLFYQLIGKLVEKKEFKGSVEIRREINRAMEILKDEES